MRNEVEGGGDYNAPRSGLVVGHFVLGEGAFGDIGIVVGVDFGIDAQEFEVYFGVLFIDFVHDGFQVFPAHDVARGKVIANT